MAGAIVRRDWNLNAPMFNFRSRNPNNLTVDYSTGADHRWPKWVTCGPRQNGVVLDDSGTEANTNAFALIPQASDTTIYWLYVAHGNKLDKLLWSDFSVATAQPSALTERVTDLLVTRTPSGTRELSAFMLATAYQVYTTIGTSAGGDTASANNEGQIIRIAGVAPNQRVIGLSGQKAYSNVLTATVTMDASSWQEIATYFDSDIIPTGIAFDQDLLVWGTNIGPLLMKAQYKEFFPAIGKVPADIDNCRAMEFVDYFGVIMGLSTMMRQQVGGFSQRVGPERFGNPNPIQGKMTALTSNVDWMFCAIRDAVNSMTYYLAAKPGLSGLPDFYCIGRDATVCEVAAVPAKATRSRETLLWGLADDLMYMTIGNTPTWPDDTSYVYREDTDQTIYGTDWYPPEPVIIEEVCFELPYAASGQTVTAGIRGTTVRGQVFDQALVKENTTGLHHYPVPQNLKGPVVHYQPYFTLRTSSNSATPKLTPQFYVMESPA